MGKPLLALRGIEVSYGPVKVLKGVDLQVEEGQIVCLLGRNGAGKTTTIRAICGLQSPAAGSIEFQGRDITQASPMDIVKAGIGTIPEGRRVFRTLTVAENLALGAYAHREGIQIRPDLSFVFDMFPRLKERRTQLAGTLSGGEQQMVAIGRALMTQPKLLLLDEPSMGLAPILIEMVFDTVNRLAHEGITILLVEQNASAALDVADHAYVLERGIITKSGEAEALQDNAEVKASYIGVA